VPKRSRGLVAALIVCAALACVPRPGGESELVVFAAASLRDVAEDLAAEFESRHPARVVFNFAGSNVLAQQIRSAPRADVFVSADRDWVEALDRHGEIVAGSKRSFLSNSLVLIAQRDSAWRLTGLEELAALDYRFLAVADPAAVPAGRYARGALERVGGPGASLWDRLADRLAPALDVRAALALVESDPRILGLVYRTDALSSPAVRVLLELEPSPGAPIDYWAARIAGGDSPELAAAFVEFLAEPVARRIAEDHGFIAGAA
jgi:molybdate transport system substrate-binding protein